MSRGDPSCPVPGQPCLHVLDDIRIEFARVKAREEGRVLTACPRCGERSRIPLAGGCYACRVRAVERDHVRGSGSGPAVLPTGSNAHRIKNEAERIWAQVRCDDLCVACAFGFGASLGIFLSRLEVDP